MYVNELSCHVNKPHRGDVPALFCNLCAFDCSQAIARFHRLSLERCSSRTSGFSNYEVT
jgi:hypothetical protein